MFDYPIWHAFRYHQGMLISLDIFLTIFHTALMLFNLLGWAHPKTRKAHVTTLLLTLAAWLLLGLYTGVLGYCPLTDWHWEIKRALGEKHLPPSFLEYMAYQVTGIRFPKTIIDAINLGGLIFGMVMAFIFNRKNHTQNKKTKQHQAA